MVNQHGSPTSWLRLVANLWANICKKRYVHQMFVHPNFFVHPEKIWDADPTMKHHKEIQRTKLKVSDIAFFMDSSVKIQTSHQFPKMSLVVVTTGDTTTTEIWLSRPSEVTTEAFCQPKHQRKLMRIPQGLQSDRIHLKQSKEGSKPRAWRVEHPESGSTQQNSYPIRQYHQQWWFQHVSPWQVI